MDERFHHLHGTRDVPSTVYYPKPTFPGVPPQFLFLASMVGMFAALGSITAVSVTGEPEKRR